MVKFVMFYIFAFFGMRKKIVYFLHVFIDETKFQQGQENLFPNKELLTCLISTYSN